MFNNFSDTLTIGGIIFSGLVSIGSLTWWLAGQFSTLKTLFNTGLKEIEKSLSDKLEYHERHDDQRFAALVNDLWEVKLRNAAFDKKTL